MNDPLQAGVARISNCAGNKLGTGFVISGSGYIATCTHVVEEHARQSDNPPHDKTLRVYFHYVREERTATIVHWLPTSEGDIALLRVEGELPSGIRSLRLGSAKFTRGHEIYTFGYPQGTRDILGVHGNGKAYGIVSTATEWAQERLQLQSMEIKAGFSGAPVWDAVRGEVIGMIAWQALRDEHGQTPGIFAITADHLQKEFDAFGVSVPITSPSPYIGARHFYEGEAPLFFGFEKICDQLIGQLQHLQLTEEYPRLLAILGPASSGKSSIIQAGLLPRLRSGAVRESGKWEVLCVQPGAEPFIQLAAQGLIHAEQGLVRSINSWLAAHPQSSRLVLVLDQFEETLLQCPPETLTSFVSHLSECLEENLATIILVMRHDVYHLLAQHHSLIKYVEKSLINLIPQQDYQTLLKMMTEPARQMGITLEPDLAETCIEDMLRATMQRQPQRADTAIPVFTTYESRLKALYDQKQGDTITYTDYASLPSFTEGIDTWTERFYQALTDQQQHFIKSLFLRLLMAENVTTVSNEIALSDLCCNEGEEDLTRQLANHGLLLISYDTQKRQELVKIVQPALMLEWHRLNAWWNEEQRFRLWQQVFASGDHTKVLRESDLKEAELWLERRASDLNDQDSQYIQESSLLQQQALLDHMNEEIQEEQHVLTRARQLAAYAQRARQEATGITRSVLLAAEALRYETCPEAYQTLHETVALLPKLNSSFSLKDTIQRIAFSADNSYILVASRNGIVWRQGVSAGSLYSDPLATQTILRDAIFNCKGDWIATLGQDAQAKVWATKTRALIATIPQPRIQHISFHPKLSSTLAVASQDGILALWQVAADGAAHTGWKERVGMLHCIQWHPNGQVLATASQDGTISIWESERGQQVAKLHHGGEISAVAFSPDDEIVASAGKDTSVKLWNWSAHSKRGKQLLPIAQFPHQETVQHMLFSPDRDLLVTSSSQTIRLWNLTQKALYREWSCTSPIYALTVNNWFIATGGADNTARLWDTISGQELLRLTHESAVRSVALSPNGRFIATGSDNGAAHIWETLQGDQILRIYHSGGATSAAFTATSRSSYLLATAGAESDIQLSHFTEHDIRFGTRLTHDGHVQDIRFSPDGHFLTSVGEDANIIIWAMPSGEQIATFKPEGPIYVLAMSQDSRFLAYADNDEGVTVHELFNEETRAVFPHHKMVRALAFIPASHLLVTGSDDGIVRIWQFDRMSETPVAYLNPKSIIHNIAVSSDGSSIGIACEDGIARVWAWEQGSKHYLPLKHNGPIDTIAFSPDGAHLATIERDSSVRVWDTTSGTLLNYLAPQHLIRTITFSPDGSYLAMTGEQQTLLWECNKDHAQAQFPHQAKVNNAIFSPDGKYLVTIGKDNIASVWIWQPADLLEAASQRLTRNLTQEEWQQYLGDEPYQRTFTLESWRNRWEKGNNESDSGEDLY
jgi:WD40 repeat protein